jgi:hypothetical protein
MSDDKDNKKTNNLSEKDVQPVADGALPEKELAKVSGGGLKGDSTDSEHKDWVE